MAQWLGLLPLTEDQFGYWHSQMAAQNHSYTSSRAVTLMCSNTHTHFFEIMRVTFLKLLKNKQTNNNGVFTYKEGG